MPPADPDDVPPGDEVEELTDSSTLVEDEDVVDAELRRELAAAFQKTPEMPFADFLEIALYHPRWGYYNRRRDILGAKGDFQTAPHVHPLFGWTIARAVQREWDKQGRPKEFQLVEIGPGAAYLMDDLWDYLHQIGQDVSHWSVALVERSESLKKVQQQRLLGKIEAEWYHDLPSVGKFQGVLIANEFLDALPFHRLVRRGTQWKELCVVARDPGARELAWKETDLSRDELDHMLPRHAPQGTVLEESVKASEWILTLAQYMQRGLALFFDYGDLQDDLIEAHPEGSLQTFGHHRAGRDPFEKLGSLDITAWVDFSPILTAAEGAGLELAGVRPQAETLYEWGMTQVAEEVARSKGENSLEAVKARLAAKTFLFGYSTHRVLQLRK